MAWVSTPETRAKMRAVMTGKTHSAEARAKMAESARNRLPGRPIIRRSSHRGMPDIPLDPIEVALFGGIK